MTKRSFVVIGLGTFGGRTAVELYRGGADVLAIDSLPEAVDHVSRIVTKAVCADATDEEVLKKIGTFEADVAIVAIRRHFDSTVLVTHLLKKCGMREILVQVNTDMEASAIQAIGATTVIFPERDMAERIARKLLVPDLVDQIPLGSAFGIIELACPDHFVGKTLVELDVRKNFGVTVVATRRASRVPGQEDSYAIATPTIPLVTGDTLIILGDTALLSKFQGAVRAGPLRGGSSGPA